MWWKTKLKLRKIYTPHIQWVVRGTGSPKDKDEVNRRDVSECDDDERDLGAHGHGKECLSETNRPGFISTVRPDLSQPTHRFKKEDTLLDTLGGILFLRLKVTHLRPEYRVLNSRHYVLLWEETQLFRVTVKVFVVYYESIKREVKRRLIYEYRCDERLKTKKKESIRLVDLFITNQQSES
jgi:hypothetical protein